MQILRTRRGLSRPVAAGLLGMSPSWVKQVEQGRIGMPRLPVVPRIAELPRVRDLADLAGDQSAPVGLFIGPGHPRPTGGPPARQSGVPAPGPIQAPGCGAPWMSSRAPPAAEMTPCPYPRPTAAGAGRGCSRTREAGGTSSASAITSRSSSRRTRRRPVRMRPSSWS
ncbi:helix-turn-helix domain-containing protein [Streptomyces sp. NBC_01754]|nr:helix-turn-helix domain-containing protein [Streptomyces sp. NBC_01754]WSC96797.1 helix-turn-helix domain-containing protein [Streptomyces sp. NBC_01754]